VVAGVFVALSLERLRRTTGYALLVVVILFGVYALVGHLVPGDMQTRQVHIPRLITFMGLDTSAMMGFISKTAADHRLHLRLLRPTADEVGRVALLQRLRPRPDGALSRRCDIAGVVMAVGLLALDLRRSRRASPVTPASSP